MSAFATVIAWLMAARAELITPAAPGAGGRPDALSFRRSHPEGGDVAADGGDVGLEVVLTFIAEVVGGVVFDVVGGVIVQRCPQGYNSPRRRRWGRRSRPCALRRDRSLRARHRSPGRARPRRSGRHC